MRIHALADTHKNIAITKDQPITHFRLPAETNKITPEMTTPEYSLTSHLVTILFFTLILA